MKKFTFSFSLATLMSLLTVFAYGQSCPSDDINDQLIQSDPVFARSYMYLEQAIAAQVALDASERTDDIYVIPVVVHVIHEGEAIGSGSNISDAQIYSAIEALNNDFRKIAGTNGDGDGVDVGIEFCLAVRDPDNQATTGIVRVDGTVVPLYADQGIEATGGVGANEETVKALSTWPREQYMNIWVVNEIEDNDAQGGVQGFAYFPVNNPIDGITVLHNAFGTVGNLKTNTALNRTLTHEVGHYFGLYHTFHSTSSCTELNCNTGGDKVCDTPPTPLNSNCAAPECSGSQQVENYMDYTSESCRNMYTEGQKVRMRTTLETDRASLLSSLGCVAVSANDCGITYIVSPSGSTCTASVTPVVTLTNYGSNALTTCKIYYNVDGIGSSYITWNGNLATGISTNVTLPSTSVSNGLHNFFAWTQLPNNVSDESATNDQHSGEFVISSGSNASLLVQLDIFGVENTWEILDASDNVVAEGGPFVNNQQGTEINTNLCIPGGCYTLVFYDSYGDGQNFTYGDFTLFDADGNVLVYESEDWGEEIANPFCVEDVVPDGIAPDAVFSASSTSACANGAIDFTDSSANIPTSWTWTFEGGTPSSSNAQHPQDITYANAGTYDVTLTVSNDFGSDTYTWNNYIVVNAGPNVTLTGTNPTCNGAVDGEVQNSVTGVGPYTYSWNSGQTSQNLSGVGAGVYVVTVTDANGCQKQKTKTLTQPTAISVNANMVAPSCFGMADGNIYAEASGGTTGYTYLWNTGANTQQLSNVGAGTYSVTVTDLNDCQKVQSFTLQQPSALAANLMEFDIACTDESGSASVSPSGGTGPYSIDWSNGSTGTSVSNLQEGNYSVDISDANGCSIETSFSITASANLSVYTNVNQISCYGMNDGGASAVVSGGTGVYTYDWNTGDESASISGLGEGTYTLNVTDSEGCDGSYSFSLTEPLALTIAVFKSDISCYGMTDGSAMVSSNGGSGAVNFNWSNGQTGNAANGFEEGIHMVTATDEHGCSVFETFMIVEPSQLVASCLLLSPETCEGSNGSAVVNIMGGTPGYTAMWNNGTGAYTVEELSAGDYSVTVTDGSGCSTEQSITIPYDCEVLVPTTQLNGTFCNATDVLPGSVIYCDAVSGAGMYQWKFTSTTGEMLTEEFSIGNAFYLSEVDGLTYGMTINTEVRVSIDGIWGNYGPVCSISMEVQLPETSLDPEDCGIQGVQNGYALTAIPVGDASAYEFHITGDDYDFTVTQLTNELIITEGMLLQPGETYGVVVRVLIEGAWSEWGDICYFTMALSNSVNNLSDTSPGLSFFPNPGSGEEIIIDQSNLSGSDVVKHLEIFGAAGNLVETIDLSASPQGVRTTYTFRHPLSTGMYIIRYALNGKMKEEKLVVR